MAIDTGCQLRIEEKRLIGWLPFKRENLRFSKNRLGYAGLLISVFSRDFAFIVDRNFPFAAAHFNK